MRFALPFDVPARELVVLRDVRAAGLRVEPDDPEAARAGARRVVDARVAMVVSLGC